MRRPLPKEGPWHAACFYLLHHGTGTCAGCGVEPAGLRGRRRRARDRCEPPLVGRRGRLPPEGGPLMSLDGIAISGRGALAQAARIEAIARRVAVAAGKRQRGGVTYGQQGGLGEDGDGGGGGEGVA